MSEGVESTKSESSKRTGDDQPAEGVIALTDSLSENEFLLDVPSLKNLLPLWKDKPHSERKPCDVQKVQEFFNNCSPEHITSNLGQVLLKLSELTPGFASYFSSTEISHENSLQKCETLFFTLMRSKSRRSRIVAMQALSEILNSSNRELIVFLDSSDGNDSVFRTLFDVFETTTNLDLLNAVLDCLLKLMTCESTWKVANELLWGKGHRPLISILMQRCRDEENPIPTMVIETVELLISWSLFSVTAVALKDTFSKMESDSACIKEYFSTWTAFEKAYFTFLSTLAASPQNTLLHSYDILAIFDDCDIMMYATHLLILNAKASQVSPPNPLPLVAHLLSTSDGSYFLSRFSHIYGFVDALTMVAAAELVPEFSTFKKLDVPLARDLCKQIDGSFKILRFCDILRAAKGNIVKLLSDKWALEFLRSVNDPLLRRQFSHVFGQNHLHLLIGAVTIPPNKKVAISDFVLQLQLFLMNIVIAEVEHKEFWEINADRIFELVKRQEKNAFTEVPEILDSALGTFIRDPVTNSRDTSKLITIFGTNLPRLSSTGLDESHVTRMQLAEYLCTGDSGRAKEQVVHALLAHNINVIIEQKLDDQLHIALPLFQSGMPAASTKFSLLLRFSLPAIRILGHCFDVNEELTLVSPKMAKYLLGLWTITSDFNGQANSTLSTKLRCSIVEFLEKNLLRRISNGSNLLANLVAEGSKRPIFFSCLLEILLVLLPESLPLPIAKSEKNQSKSLTETHALKVKFWVENLVSLEETKLGEVLLCSTPYIKDLELRIFQRVASYENDELIDYFTRMIIKYMSEALGDVCQLENQSASTSENDKEGEESRTNQTTRATSGQARLMESIAELCSLPVVSSSVTRVISKDSPFLSNMMFLFTQPWQNSERHFTYQDRVLEFIHCLFNCGNTWTQSLENDQEGENLLKTLLHTLLMFIVDESQSSKCVLKAARVLEDATTKEGIEKQEFIHQLSPGLFAPLFQRVFRQDDPIIFSAAATVSQIFITGSSSNPALIRYAVFNPTEGCEQPLESLVEKMDYAKTEKNEQTTAIFELYRLAVEASESAFDAQSFKGDISLSKETRRKPFFIVFNSPLEVFQEMRRRTSKRDCRESRSTRIGSELLQILLKNTGDSAANEKNEKRIKNEEPISIEVPQRIEWM